MNILLLLFIFLILSSHTYVSYITFLLCMINLVLSIFLLGNSYLSLVYLIIYIGSIAILFIYILMVFELVSSYRSGYFLFLLPFTTLSLLGLSWNHNGLLFNFLTYSYSIYSSLLLPLAILLFVAMIFAIRSI
jgi:NADH:ubiquinone oxidoreductase subunit 6 (subunit J)